MVHSPSKRSPVAQAAEYEEEVVDETPSNSLMSRLTRFSEQVASTALGQYAIKKLDNVLWTIEKTTKWSLPQYTRLNYSTSGENKNEEQEEVASGEKIHEPPLMRPLPWLFFIPMLIALRMVRTGLSVVALLLRKGPVTPIVMVHFIQSRRRKLRAIKYTGLRNIRIRYIEAAEQRKNGKVVRQSIFARLRGLFSLFLCGRYGETVRPLKVTVKKARKDRTPGSEGRKKRHANDSDEEELGCNELLEKLAKEDDSNDSSFASDTIMSSDITISDDESETDNILNKTMNEKETPKYATPKYRKSRSYPNSGSSAQGFLDIPEPTNANTFQYMSTPKRSHSNTVVSDNGSESKMKNGGNGTTEEVKKSPNKTHAYMNGAVNNRPNHRPNRQSIEYYKNVANEMVIHEDEQVYVNGDSKEMENSENPESINNLPESQRNEALQKPNNNHQSSNNFAQPKNPERSHGRGKHHKRRNSYNSQNKRNGSNAGSSVQN